MQFTTQSIFSIGAQVLVDPVNLEGRSGAGLALEFRNRYPAAEAQFRRACALKEISFTNPLLVPVGENAIVYYATKRAPEDPSLLENVIAGLPRLRELCDERNQAVAIPRLGCGLGNLDWSIVSPHIVEAFGSATYPVYVCVGQYLGSCK